jgi:hypothetical protein
VASKGQLPQLRDSQGRTRLGKQHSQRQAADEGNNLPCVLSSKEATISCASAPPRPDSFSGSKHQ